jgi:hypothetical protein
MSATFIFIMVVLKIPIVMLLTIVWWAIKATPENEAPPVVDEDGGTKDRPRAHPRPRRPRPPRRGPHGDPPVPAPARTRTVVARGRRVGS